MNGNFAVEIENQVSVNRSALDELARVGARINQGQRPYLAIYIRLSLINEGAVPGLSYGLSYNSLYDCQT